MNTRRWLAETRMEDAATKELYKTEKRIADMEIGERGYTVSWAFSTGYSVLQAPCKTSDTLIERTEDGWKVIETDPGPATMREHRRSLLRRDS